MKLPSSERFHGRCMKFLIEFQALFIKTCLLAKRKRAQTIIEILLAYTFMGLLLGMRHILDRDYNHAFRLAPFRPQDTTYFRGSSGKIVYYYPLQVLYNSNISSLSDSVIQSIYAYIYFTNIDSSCISPSTMPDQINYTLRMQENEPYYYRAQSVKLQDNVIFWKRSPVFFCHNKANHANYWGQFLGVQYFVDLSIIQYATNVTLNPSSIYMNHFGCPEYYYDELHSNYNFLISIFYSAIYMVTFLMNVGYIVEERENKTKEYLCIFGLRSWINNLVWITRSMCIFTVLTCVVTGFSLLVLPSSGQSPGSISKSIFTNTHWTLIWTIMFVYSIHVSTFSVLFGQFFKSPVLAKLLGFSLWIITSINFYSDASVGVQYFMCLFPNTGLLFCIQILLQYERKSVGMTTFEQLYSNIFPCSSYIGIYLLVMVIYSIIYYFLGIYIGCINPGEFGVSQPWNYLFKKSYWKPQISLTVRPIDGFESNKNDEIYDSNCWIEPNFIVNTKLPSVTVTHVTKKFGRFQAISDLSLDFYRGEVCSLLGHNGAGKTTTLFILVGMLEPTSGSVIIEGLDNQQYIQVVRKMLGFCPQHDILYNELSVKEHLELFAKMRHMKTKIMNETIDTILDLIGLVNDEHTLAKNLSGGMKRRLSIGISLIGDPKVLVLDEPTSGIDPYNRRFIWTIIQKLKEAGKCIIMTTHFLEEADVLSDRIAIITKGRLKANGTPDFLKQQTEFEYHLLMNKQDILCDSQRVSKFIQEYVETAVLERESTSELTYGIKHGESKYIGQLLNALEQRKHDIGINGYGLSMTTIEEVFLRLVQEEAEEDHDSNRELADKVFRTRHEYITGISLFWTRVWALLVKRWIVSRRELIFLFGFLLCPILIEILTVVAIPTPQKLQELIFLNGRIPDAQVTLIPSIYNPQTIVTYANNNRNNAQSRLLTYLASTGASVDEISVDDVHNYVVARYNESEDVFVNKYQMGFALYNNLASLTPSLTINAYFSTVNYHIMPTSLGVSATNLFQFYGNSSSKSIITTNQPILTRSPSLTSEAECRERIYCFDILPVSLFNFMNSIIVSLFVSILIMTYVRERLTHSKDLQLLTNLTKGVYWFSNTIFDLFLCFIVCTLLAIILKIGVAVNPDIESEVHIYTNVEQIGYFFLMIIMYSLASLPFIYTFSFTAQTESMGFLNFFLINIIACVLDAVLSFKSVYSQILQRRTTTKGATKVTTTMNNIRWLVSLIFPSINFKDSIYNIRLRSDKNCISAFNSIMYTNYSVNESWMSLNKPGLGIHVIIFSVQMIIWWILFILIENRVNIKQIARRYCCSSSNRLKQTEDDSDNNRTSPLLISREWDDSHLDEDVRNERRMILKENQLSTSAVILVRDLVQKFKKRKEKSVFRRVHTAVDHLSFRVEQQSCFGLLGANGAGKTTTFRMLINNIQPTSGDIIINGKNINKAQRDLDIGFCPQFDWLVENLDVMETMILFARLKGLRADEISEICHNMIKLFGLNTYERRQVQSLSGGNKRKVSAALAFMANPTLVVLDEPTTGLDAVAKRKLWDVIRAARDVGLTIIMTSHSMEECEALCTKIGIMKSGQFMCIGNLQHLKDRFGHGYTIQVKICVDRIDELKDELFNRLPGIEIEDQHNGMLFCNVPFSSSSFNLAHLFEMFNTKKEEKIIESYSITQTKLEQIFVRLAGEDNSIGDISSQNDSINATAKTE